MANVIDKVRSEGEAWVVEAGGSTTNFGSLKEAVEHAFGEVGTLIMEAAQRQALVHVYRECAAIYRNETLDSASAGQMIAFFYGEGCTYATPPDHAPDGVYGAGWKYLLCGTIDFRVCDPFAEQAQRLWRVKS